MIFSTPLSKEIALKLLGEMGTSFFGIRVMKEVLMLSRATFPA